MEVLRKMKDGTLHLGYAYWSHRRGPIGEWWQGDKPLSEHEGEIIARGSNARKMFEERGKECPSSRS